MNRPVSATITVPTDLKEAVLWVRQPESDEATATDEDADPVWGGSGFVYEKHILWRSWLTLRDRDQITLPDDIEPLIELVYDDDRLCPEDLSEEWKRAWNTTKEQLIAKREKDKAEAEKRLIKPPKCRIQSLVIFIER